MPDYFSNTERWDLMSAGIRDLETFIDRCVVEGIGGQPALLAELLEQAAARLVDHKCGGVARRLRVLAEDLKQSREGWISEVIYLFGQLKLLCSQVRQSSLEELNTHPLWLAWAGWNFKQDQVLKAQPSITDDWMVMGIKTEKEEKLRVQRTWFWGVKSKRAAIYLEYLVPFTKPAVYWVTGKIYHMQMTYYPGALNIRALPGNIDKQSFSPWPFEDGFSVMQTQQYVSEAMVYFPLMEHIPVFLKAAYVELDAKKNVHVGDETGSFVETHIDSNHLWTLVALADQKNIALFGEMTKGKFTILSCGFRREFHRLT